MMVGKKGEMSSAQLGGLLIVVVLVVIIIFSASSGIRSGFAKLIGFGGGESNVGSIATQCAVFCNQKDSYEFCTNPRDVVLGDKTTFKETCNNLATMDEPKARTGSAIKPCVDLCPPPVAP
jgi:hypothetical protein